MTSPLRIKDDRLVPSDVASDREGLYSGLFANTQPYTTDPDRIQLDGSPQQARFRPPLFSLAFFSLLDVLKRQLRLIIILTLVMSALSAVAVMRMKTTYTASATVLLDQRGARPLEKNEPGPLNPDGEVEFMKSESVALRVVEKLDLANLPEFVPEPGPVSSMLASIKDLFPQAEEPKSADPASDPSQIVDGAEFKPVSDKTATALRNLTSKILIRRRGLSDIIAIEATSLDRRLAARIANAYAQAYLDEQVAPKLRGVERTEAILTRQIEELNEELKRSETHIGLRQIYQDTQLRLKAVSQQRDMIAPDSRIASLARAPGGGGLIPPKLLGMIGAIFACFSVSFGIAYLRDMHTRRVQTEDELELISGVPNIAAVPAIAKPSRPNGSLADDIVTRPSSPYSIAIRRLYFNLQMMMKNGPKIGIVLVTSTEEDEGRTTLALSLARSAAAAGSRVALIDCDLRKPKLHQVLGLQNGAGFVDLLSRSAGDRNGIHNDPISTCKIIVGGETADVPPERLLTADRLKDLARRLKSEFDLVILDAPPIGSSADPLILASIIDAALFVVRAGGPDPGEIQSSLNQLRRANDTDIVTVLTFKSS